MVSVIGRIEDHDVWVGSIGDGVHSGEGEVCFK